MSKKLTNDEAQAVVNELHGQGIDLLTILVRDINDEVGKQYEDFVEIAEDLMIAAEALLTSIQLPDGAVVLRQSLQVNAIMSYIRCFNDSDGRKYRIEETPKWIGSGQKVHEMLKHARNQLFAHAGITPFRECKVEMMFGVAFNGKPAPNSLPEDTPMGIHITQARFAQFENHDVKEFIKHIENLINKVDDQKDKIRDVLVKMAGDAYLQNRSAKPKKKA